MLIPFVIIVLLAAAILAARAKNGLDDKDRELAAMRADVAEAQAAKEKLLEQNDLLSGALEKANDRVNEGGLETGTLERRLKNLRRTLRAAGLKSRSLGGQLDACGQALELAEVLRGNLDQIDSLFTKTFNTARVNDPETRRRELAAIAATYSSLAADINENTAKYTSAAAFCQEEGE